MKMKILAISGVMAMFLAPQPAMALSPASTVHFFRTLGDVPVMPDLTEIPARETEFDQPQGRIAEGMAVSTSARADDKAIDAFYQTTLPQLGWRQNGADTYVRDNETLTVRTGLEKGFSTVRLTIAPR